MIFVETHSWMAQSAVYSLQAFALLHPGVFIHDVLEFTADLAELIFERLANLTQH
jgi:hypothetical protein